MMRSLPQREFSLPLKEITWAVTDVETTGLSPQGGDRVCEIAVIRAGPEGVHRLQTLIHPGRPIPPEASSINGISNEMVAGAPSFAEVAQKVEDYLRGAVFVAHNAPFDRGFFEAEFRACGRTLPDEPTVDTLLLARRLLRLSSNTLGDVTAYLGISVQGQHRALGDAEATWAVLSRFLEMLSERGGKTLGDLIEAGGTNTTRPPPAPVLAEVEAALQAKRPLRLVYLSADGRATERTVDPLGLIEAGNHTYIEAFCHLRQDKRHFRLDRIRSIRPA